MLVGRPTIGFVAVTDRDRALGFYRDTLRLRFVADDGYALVFEAGDRMLRVVLVEDLVPQPFAVLGWEVPDGELAPTLASLRAAGVEVLRFGVFEQDADGIWTAPNGDRVAWFADPDGNVLSLSSHQGAS